MSDEEQIKKLKNYAIDIATSSKERKTTIDTLAVYGEPAIPAITEIVEETLTNGEVRLHGLETIKKIKEKSRL